MSDQTPTTRTRDLGLAAALVSRDFILRATTRDTSGRYYFEFKQSRFLTEAINAYWADKLTVRARTLNDNIKMLKSRIYAEE